MKTLTVALVGFVALLGPIPGLRGLAAAQGTVTRIAYDQWAPNFDIWGTMPYVHVWVDRSDTLIAIGYGPRWSPDGSRLAFTGSSDADAYGLDEIVVANVADGSLANLSNHPAYDVSPAWSPDGGKIAFVTNRDGSVELYVMSVDGSNPTRLTHNVGFMRPFAWSPDGGRIAFASDRDGAPELYVMGADGSNPMRLTYGVGFMGEFDWSRAGEKLAFTCEMESGNLDICTIDADGTDIVRLTSDAAGDSAAEFSPVDGKIVFTAAGEIAVLDGDGTLTLVGAAGSQPRWSTDASRLAFVGTTVSWIGRCYLDEGAHNADDFCVPADDIYVVNVDGTGLTRIASGGGVEWFIPPPGQPMASFTYNCPGSTCDFDGSGSVDSDGTIASYAWQFGDGTSSSGATAGHTYATGDWYIVTLTVTDDTGAMGVLSMQVDANAAPAASFTFACDKNTCTFDGSGSSDPDGTIASYYWSFGDGNGDSAVVTHTYAMVGTYSVTLTVWDEAGAMGSHEVLVDILTVNAPPLASFTSSCIELTCSVDASGSSDSDGLIASHTWKFGDGTTASGMTASHAYAAGGTYMVTLTVADDNGATNTHAANVTVVPPEMHLGDLDHSRTMQQSMWTALVTITVHHGAHGPLASATVSGSWNNGSTSSCTTGASGQCTVSQSSISKRISSVSFTVLDVARAPYVYKPASNHDPDGESNETPLSISRH